jgi:uncharacterized repeat protein (TIGR02543 family)
LLNINKEFIKEFIMKKSNLWGCVVLALGFMLAGCPSDDAEPEETEQGTDAVAKTIKITGLPESGIEAQVAVFSGDLSNPAATGSGTIADQTLSVDLYDLEGGSRWTGIGKWSICLRLAEGDGYADYLWKDGQKYDIKKAVTTLPFADFERDDKAVAGIPVTFVADGGIPPTQTKSAVNGWVALPTEPTKFGCTFGGWYTSTDGGGTEFTASTPVTDPLTVYAKWSDGSVFITSVADLKTFLDATPGGSTSAAPILVRMNVDLADGTDGWEAILAALYEKGKYVDLDLSACAMSGTEFDPGSTDDGKGYITGLALPDTAESISEPPAGSYLFSVFTEFLSLRTFSAAGVTSVRDYAFFVNDLFTLTTVSLPAATSIGADAFCDNKKLTTVSLPAATSIGADAFEHCISLKTVYLPAAPPLIVPDETNGMFYQTQNYSPDNDNTITIVVPDAAAVAAYIEAWHVSAVTAVRANPSVYGNEHKAVTITATP